MHMDRGMKAEITPYKYPPTVRDLWHFKAFRLRACPRGQGKVGFHQIKHLR